MKNSGGLTKRERDMMLRIRLFEHRAAAEHRAGRIHGPMHLCAGQEMTAIEAMKYDIVFGNHRSHGHYLAAGGSMKRLAAELLGKPKGCNGGRGISMHIQDREHGFMPTSAIVGGTIPHALGFALSVKLREGDKRRTCCFVGDGALETGLFGECWKYANDHGLPITYLGERNGWVADSPREDQDSRIERLYGHVGYCDRHGWGVNPYTATFPNDKLSYAPTEIVCKEVNQAWAWALKS